MSQHPSHSSVYISFAAVAWAMGSPLTGLHRLTLIELARHADAGGRCWPAMGTIAKRLGKSTRWTRRIVSELERDGYLSRAIISGRGAIFQLHMAVETPFSTPEAQFRGPEETPEAHVRTPRKPTSGSPRKPTSAKQRASSNENKERVPNRNGANSRAGSVENGIRNPERYANAKLYYQLKQLWNTSDMGPVSASTSNASAGKARVCSRVQVLLRAMNEQTLIRRVKEVIKENENGDYYVALDATLDQLISSRGLTHDE